MPSDATTADLAARALEALDAARAAFRSAVAEAVDAAAALLDARGSEPRERVARTAGELGAFARDRIDPDAFTGLFSVDEPLDPAAVAALGEARAALTSIAEAGDDAFRVDVEPGGDLRDAVAAALADLGRAFAAGRAIERVVERRSGGGEPIGPLPFRAWTAAERALAPPLVVAVDGADLDVGGLAAFLDGAVKIVIAVRGPSPPAPLARLVSPSVAVVQAVDPEAIGVVASAPGPGVAALLPETAARFAHDPAAGADPAARWTIDFLPDDAPLPRLGGSSAFRQAEDLRLLSTLASARPASPVAAAPSGSAGAAPALPADRLAAWLLSRADRTGLETGNGSAA